MSGGKKPSCSASVSLYSREKGDLEMGLWDTVEGNKGNKTPAASYVAAVIRKMQAETSQ